jgi:hypothetical protein
MTIKKITNPCRKESSLDRFLLLKFATKRTEKREKVIEINRIPVFKWNGRNKAQNCD